MVVNTSSMYVWDGILEANERAGNGFDVTFYGTVTVTDTADARKVQAPVRNAFKAFCDSDKEFRVTGTAVPVDGSNDGNRFKPSRLTFTGGEGWELDGKKHLDKSFEVVTSIQWKGSPDQRDSLCFASGSDEYGTFIGTGWMRPGNRITLARRYVSDERAQWGTTKIQQEVIKKIWDDEEEECEMPPWKCATFNGN